MIRKTTISIAIASVMAAMAQPVLANETRAIVITATNNITTGTAPVSVNFLGSTFVNRGLVASGTVAATALDGLGHTLGSMSDMVIDLSNWRRNGNTYSGGILIVVPDRGYNNTGAGIYADYAARLQRYSITLTPDYTTNAAGSTLTLGFIGTQVLKDNNGNNFTGNDPGTGVAMVLGARVPTPTAGNVGAGRISLDAEGLAFRKDGGFYISDEYAANIYYFDSAGRLAGIIAPPAALTPITAGVVNFNATDAPTTGRNRNQGLEGLAITPDGKKLASLLQSSAFQDGDRRPVTRLMIYDISSNATPTAPSESYAMVLPTRGATTYSQSALLALNSKQFLVLARDGRGLGSGATAANGGEYVYKSILLVDTAGATNIAGSTYETTATPLAPGGTLVSSVTPVWQAEIVNMLNSTQLGRFGVNLNANNSQNTSSLSEKWEALGIAPVLDPAAPNDYFLFTGNDNDFLATACTMPLSNGTSNCNSAYSNDQRVLVYRLTLPTYVNSAYLEAMTAQGRVQLAAMRNTGQRAMHSIADAVSGYISGENLRQNHGFDNQTRGFVQGSLQQQDASSEKVFSGALGIEFPVSNRARVGLSVLADNGRMKHGVGKYDSATLGLGAHMRFKGNGWLARIGAARAETDFDDIERNDPFGLIARGTTRGESSLVSTEAGLTRGNWYPFLGYEWHSNKIKGYTESGAAGGDIAYSTSTERTERLLLGAQWADTVASQNEWRPVVRFSIAQPVRQRGKDVALSLAHVAHADATQTVTLSDRNKLSFNTQAQIVRNLTRDSQISLGLSVALSDMANVHGGHVRYMLSF